ncbi:PLP-dependent aminotransferase family protein [Gemmatimonas sp.]|uniref:aminotransferase-like domain-containing protein n=1 Tax=Gemmatimonas sp. TaxID=1962908 RepID=UPI003DA6C074
MQTDTTVPSAIDFGKGQPSLSLLPAAALHTAAERVLAQHDPLWLRYGDDQDEAPTDFLALDIFRDHGLRVVGVPIDDEGMQMPALHDALAAHRPSMLYTIPSFQNPTGATLSASRREQLLAACAAHDVLVVADEVYQLLDFGAPPPPSVATYVSGARVLSLGSFSKICAPGLRLGWVHGAPALLEQLMHAGLVQSGGGLNPFTSGVVHSLITLGLADRVLDDLKLVYAERSRVLCEALRDAIPDARLVEPSGRVLRVGAAAGCVGSGTAILSRVKPAWRSTPVRASRRMTSLATRCGSALPTTTATCCAKGCSGWRARDVAFLRSVLTAPYDWM